MSFLRITLLTALASSLLTGCAKLKPVNLLNWALPGGHFTLVQDVAYGDLQRQLMDIYLPKCLEAQQAEGSLAEKPLIVFVHGGAWRHGDKQEYRFVAQALTKLGYAVMIPNYRLFPAVKFPGFVDDVALAIATLERQADELMGAPMQSFILMGHSAGAHTAALLTTDRHYLQAQQVNSQLRALIALAGPYDLNLADPEVEPVFMPGASPLTARPVRQVSVNSQTDAGLELPPIFLLHGEQDNRVGVHHTERFAKALSQAGLPVSQKRYAKVNHVNIIASMAAPLRFLSPTFEDIKLFLAAIHES